MNTQSSILVVDDDFSGRAMLSLSLRQAGYTVHSAGGGADALRLLKNWRYDWLITDAKMEPIDGFELSQAAKRAQPDLHVIMISAVHAAGDVRGYPIDRFFEKPLPMERLLELISPEGSI